ncbi:hypothetical protein EST38_g13623 [Candolleomyces aberdarensis]|uniref:Uncharacterized protein n=1 Tax=Candolleomyces aberdarensis TaxID=2316362 RepID=A0A4Q2D1R5_9AGAR|nr:hypothetical protein EST38_g13623 [Candolleomyces aberdarensis]
MGLEYAALFAKPFSVATVDRKDTKPSPAAASASASEKAEAQSKIDSWVEKLDSAKGTILLKIHKDLCASHMENDAPKIWADLLEAYDPRNPKPAEGICVMGPSHQ